MNSHFQKDSLEILQQRLRRGEISRRSFAQGLGLLFGASALGLSAGRGMAETKELIFVNWGGDAIKAMDAAFGKSFFKERGIKVKYDGSGPTEGAITAQEKSGKPSWDLVDCDPFSGQALGKKGMMEKIDYTIVDTSKIRPGFKWDYAASSYFYSYIIAYDKTQFKTPPSSMADFFDLEKFPGKRSMYKWGAGMWEAALLADGVAPDKLYPLDLDRAHKKIADFKKNVSVFWGSGAESQSSLLNGDVAMGLIWNTRAQLVRKDSEGDIDYTWDQGILAPGSSGVLKNNPGGAKAAMDYIASTQAPEKQVVLFKMLGNGPANPAADKLIPADMQKDNPVDPANFSKQIPLDMAWYEENYSAALDAYLKVISA
ncbi:ABC transporter substrate-binding protein [Thioclava sp. BHET1]|nr:ABC transporter substrate-binding protein [Thioclava sp. BHET1]